MESGGGGGTNANLKISLQKVFVLRKVTQIFLHENNLHVLTYTVNNGMHLKLTKILLNEYF